MRTLTEKEKKEALKDLEMYFGKPPFNIEEIKPHISSGLFEEQALMKYGFTPIELIHKVSEVHLTAKQKQDALKDLKMYFGEPPVSQDFIDQRLSSGLLEIQILAKYMMTVKELISEVGFSVKKK
jgi:hypothetical protein